MYIFDDSPVLPIPALQCTIIGGPLGWACKIKIRHSSNAQNLNCCDGSGVAIAYKVAAIETPNTSNVA